MNDQERQAAIERLRVVGKKGGIATRRKLGKKHYQNIGSKGGKSRWKKD